MSIVTKIFSKLNGSANARPSLDSMLAIFDKELGNFSSLVLPSPESKPRTPFDSPNILPLEKSSVANMSPSQLMTVSPVMGCSFTLINAIRIKTV